MVGHVTDHMAMHIDDYTELAHRAGTNYTAKRKGGSRAGSGKRHKAGDSADGTNIQGAHSDAGAQTKRTDVAEIVDRFLHGVLPGVCCVFVFF